MPNSRIEMKQGDSLDLLPKIQAESIDAIITDPPYFCGFTHNGKKGEYSDLNMTKPFFKEVFQQFKRVLKPNGEIYLFCDWRTYPFLYPILSEILTIRNLIVWDKKSGPGNMYSYSHELIIFATNESPKFKKNKKGRNVWVSSSFASGAKKTNGKKVHPTQKPVELIEEIVLKSTNQGDTVLDAFMGSGTTALACQRLDRNFIGYELQEKYFDIAKQRLKHTL